MSAHRSPVMFSRPIAVEAPENVTSPRPDFVRVPVPRLTFPVNAVAPEPLTVSPVFVEVIAPPKLRRFSEASVLLLVKV